MEIDRKFKFVATHKTKGVEFTDREAVVFLAKDNAFPAALQFYREECVRQGAGDLQIKGVDLLIERVALWRKLNPSKCKTPDIEPGQEGIVVLRPNP